MSEEEEKKKLIRMLNKIMKMKIEKEWNFFLIIFLLFLSSLTQEKSQEMKTFWS